MKAAPPPDIVDSVVADWRRARPETRADAIQIVGRIIWLGRQYEETVARMLSEPGLSYSDYDVLATLRRAGSPYELTPTELSRRVLLTSGGLTACLRRLETADLISRRGVPEDRRRLLAKLTPKGFDLIESFVDQRFDVADQALANLDAEQRAALEVLLRRLVSPAGGVP
jgi:DNA-binding MarR family transcriptional regulator